MIKVEKFEDYIEKNHTNGIWKNLIEIEEITGEDIHIIITDIDNSFEFCKNSQGKYTTRKMYEKYTSFWRKLLDVSTNKFN